MKHVFMMMLIILSLFAFGCIEDKARDKNYEKFVGQEVKNCKTDKYLGVLLEYDPYHEFLTGTPRMGLHIQYAYKNDWWVDGTLMEVCLAEGNETIGLYGY